MADLVAQDLHHLLPARLRPATDREDRDPVEGDGRRQRAQDPAATRGPRVAAEDAEQELPVLAVGRRLLVLDQDRNLAHHRDEELREGVERVHDHRLELLGPDGVWTHCPSDVDAAEHVQRRSANPLARDVGRSEHGVAPPA